MTKHIDTLIREIKTGDELDRVAGLLKDRLASLSDECRANFGLGDKVEFTGKFGLVLSGRVVKILPKNIKVQTFAGADFNVNPAMLRLIEAAVRPAPVVEEVENDEAEVSAEVENVEVPAEAETAEVSAVDHQVAA